MSVAKERWQTLVRIVRYKDWTGETKQHKKEGFERDPMQRSRAKIPGAEDRIPDMSVQSLYTLYMEDCKTRLKPTTYANKDFLFQRHVLPYLGKLQASLPWVLPTYGSGKTRCCRQRRTGQMTRIHRLT